MMAAARKSRAQLEAAIDGLLTELARRDEAHAGVVDSLKAEHDAKLSAICDEHHKSIAEERVRRQSAEREMHDARRCERETRAQFGDLKERLVRAEADNQRMRGYIERVQEDDVAREDLVTVGDPNGEQQLVPKRKPKHFTEPNAYTDFGSRGCSTYEAAGYAGNQERKPPRHYVTY